MAGEAGRPDGEDLALSVAPNPTGGAATVRLSLTALASVRVTVYDAVGRVVAVAWDGPALDGQQVAVETAGWAAGVYVVRAVGRNGASATSRLTVAR